MLSEWAAECGVDDPCIVVPWASEDGSLHWVDLRTDPNALDEISEADEYPAMLNALRVLNSARSPVFTSKCDVWAMDESELAALRYELVLDDDVATAGVACYIDILFRDGALFRSRHQQQGMLGRLDRGVRDMGHSLAKLECIMRHAVLDLGTVQEGFAITLYVKGCGVDEFEAQQRWEAALRDVTSLLRGLEVPTLRTR